MSTPDLLIRSFGFGTYSVEEISPSGIPTHSLAQIILAVEKSGFSPIAAVEDEKLKGHIFMVCAEGHEPCELEIAQLQIDWDSLVVAAAHDPILFKRVQMLDGFRVKI